MTWMTCCPGGGSAGGTEDGFIFLQGKKEDQFSSNQRRGIPGKDRENSETVRYGSRDQRWGRGRPGLRDYVTFPAAKKLP